MYLAPEFGNTEVEDPVGSGGLDGGEGQDCQPGAATDQQDEPEDSQHEDPAVLSSALNCLKKDSWLIYFHLHSLCANFSWAYCNLGSYPKDI